MKSPTVTYNLDPTGNFLHAVNKRKLSTKLYVAKFLSLVSYSYCY